MTESPRRHLHLDSGPLHLDFQGPADQIRDVAADLAATGQFTVRVDDDVHPDQASLPCGQLWGPQSPTAATDPGSCPSLRPLDGAPIDEGITMFANTISAIKSPDDPVCLAPERDRQIADRARIYREVFGLDVERTRDGDALAMRIGHVAAVMVPRRLATELCVFLGSSGGPVFSYSGHSWVFLCESLCTAGDLSETALALYRRHGVMALVSPGLHVGLPTPGDADRCWIQPPDGDRMPVFAEVVAALAVLESRNMLPH